MAPLWDLYSLICATERWDRRLKSSTVQSVDGLPKRVCSSVCGESGVPNTVSLRREVSVPVSHEKLGVHSASGDGLLSKGGII
jgi:hypothetical protein